MSFFFGGHGKKVKPDYTGIQLQTSSSVQALTIAWGTNRIGPNLIWYNDFKAHKVKQKAGKGGGGSSTSYTYSSSVMMALCEGAIHGVGQVYKDSETPVSFASIGMSLFTGENPQAVWGYLTSNHPDQARDYAGVAYLAVANYDLGSSASLPNHSFETYARQYKTAADGSNDADPAVVVDEFLTHSSFGVGLVRTVLDLTTLYSTVGKNDASYQTYCAAQGFGLSPVLSDQTAASDTLALWMQVTNTAPVWTGYSFKFIPYDLTTITANGYTYTPNTTAAYDITDEDYVSNKDDPIKVTRADPADAYNQLTLNVNDRNNQYNQAPADWRDQGLIDQYGLIPGSSISADCITSLTMGNKVVRLAGQRLAYIRNSYSFILGQAHILVEPMDLLWVNDPEIGRILVQISTVEEDDDYQLTITADEVSAAVTSAPGDYTPGSVISNSVNQASPPGPVNTPMIFDVPSDMSNGIAQVWAAVSGGNDTTAGIYWGGCTVYVSTDDISYNAIGTIDTPARMGKTTNDLPAYGGSNPEAVTFNVTLAESLGELVSVSADDAATFATISRVGTEFISYETATLTALNAYDLSTIYRALYQSNAVDHPSGTSFARLDEAIFKFNLPKDIIGVPLWFKFQSFNLWGNTPEDLSTCVAYTYTPSGLGFSIAPPTAVGLTFASRTQADGTSIIRGTITLTPSPGPYLDHQDVQITHDGGATWEDISGITEGSDSTFFEPALGATNYQARARAVSSAVGGTPSAWVTTGVVNSGALGGSAPDAPTGLAGNGLTLSNGLTWTPGVGSGGVPQGFYIYAHHGASGVFADAVKVGSATLDLFYHVGLGSSDTWRYYVTAYNAAGESAPDGPLDLTTDSSGGGGSIEVDSPSGTPIVTTASKLSFSGPGVTVTAGGTGEALIDITGGSTGEAAWEVSAVGTGASQDVIIPDIDPTSQSVMVFVNGLRWQTTEYTIAGNVVTLTTNSTGDSIEIVGPLGEADGTAFLVDAVGTGVPQDVTLPFALTTTQSAMVFVNGLRWQSSEYTIVGNVLTLTTNSAGDSVEIVGPLGFVTVTGGGGGGGQSSEAKWNLPDLTSLTWLNQGPATALSDGHGTVIKAPTSGSNFRILYKPRPIGDFDVYARIDELSGSDGDFGGGICLLDSATGKFIHWSNNTTNPVTCYLQTMNSPTSFNGNQIGPEAFMQVPKWLRMNITGTVATCYASTNGIDWISYGSYNFGGFFTPDSIGVNVNAHSVDRDTRFLHFGTVLPTWS